MQRFMIASYCLMVFLISVFLFWPILTSYQIQTQAPHATQVTIYDFKNFRYNTDGVLQHILYAQHASSAQQNLQNIQFLMPILDVFDAQGQLRWQVSSQQAQLRQQRYLQLNTHIELQKKSGPSLIESIHTEQLNMDLKKYTIANDTAIFLTGQTFTTQGVGLQGTLQDNVFQLLKETYATYQSD